MQPETSSSFQSGRDGSGSLQPRAGFLRVTVCIYVCWLIPSLIFLVTGFPSSKESAGAQSQDYCIRLLLAAWLTMLILERDFGWKRALGAALIVILGAGMVEIIGEISGFPFGHFIYTEKLSGRLFGSAPWVVPIGWFVFVINAYLVCCALVAIFTQEVSWDGQLLLVLMTAMVVTLLDLVLEPVATNVEQYRYWLERDRSYYGVPVSSFIGWFTATLVFAGILSFQLNPARAGQVARRYRLSTGWISLGLLASIGLPLAIQNWQVAQYMPVLVALNLIGGLAIGLAYVSGK